MSATDAEPLPRSVLEALGRYDTPTICNALELVAPERRLTGFTVRPLVCPFPDLPPIVGYARTATIRSTSPTPRGKKEERDYRMAYYTYVGSGPAPRISVIQDLDGAEAGCGSFWGEVHSAVHKALGCLGVVTDGSVRDIPQFAEGFQALAGMIAPSHAHVHLAGYGEDVRIAGMSVRSGDLVHADRHGAVVIPIAVAAKVPEAAELCNRREAPILAVARGKDFTIEKLRAALASGDEIH